MSAASPSPSKDDMAFQPAFNARLIEEVKQHQCLYNHTRRGSGDTIERMKLWDTIAKKIDNSCSGEFAKKRWLQLRDRYRKELKMAIKNNFVTPIRWCYFSQLSWLDPYLKDNIALAADGMHLDGTTTPQLQMPNSGGNGQSGSPAGFNWFDFSTLTSLQDENMDENDDLESMDAPYDASASVLDRLLATTHPRPNSTSPGMDNDDSGPHSVGTSGLGVDVEDEQAPTSSENRPTTSTPTSGHFNHHDDTDGDMEAASGNEDSPSQKRSDARFATSLATQLANLPKGPVKNENGYGDATTHTQLPPFTYKDQYLRQNRQHQQQHLLRAQMLQAGRMAMDWMNDEDLLYCRIIGLKLKKMDVKKRKKIRDQIMALLDESEPENEETTNVDPEDVEPPTKIETS
ncbi:unnamed protein product [Caenorhabditis auriculariae]|uniref:MADF domain-containing protein n=1 Tax=Caenorhabditis auriculariae TaxID=2777116 RepID=A0A8S1HEX1_9PELO|nr:unnamed protein product [Caenorhabditis auriculariae]